VTPPARAVAVVAAVAVVVGGCHHTSRTRVDRPVTVVTASEAAGAGIVVVAAGRSAPVPAGVRAPLAPLVAARVLDHPEAPASYGLDHPQARLAYMVDSRQTAVVLVGASDFDHHFLYVDREGDRRVFLVPAVVLRPVLALVGVTVPEPS